MTDYVNGGVSLSVESSDNPWQEDTKMIYLGLWPEPRVVHETRELLPGIVFADFDKDGRLIGIEILENGGNGDVSKDNSS